MSISLFKIRAFFFLRQSEMRKSETQSGGFRDRGRYSRHVELWRRRRSKAKVHKIGWLGTGSASVKLPPGPR